MSKKIIFCIIIIFLIFANPVLAQSSKISIIEYEKEVLIERGWIKYFSVVVKNTGEKDLHNLSVYVGGESYTEWFEVQINKTDILEVNQTSKFIIKIAVPFNVEVNIYPFYLLAKSEETSDRKSFVVNVFASRAELILYQIQKFRNEIKELEEGSIVEERKGKNVTTVREMLSEAKSSLSIAESYVHDKLYDDATKKIREVEDSLKRARYELEIAPPIYVASPVVIPFEWLLIIIILICIISYISFRIIRGKKKIKIRAPELKIKEMISERKELKGIEKDLENAKEALEILEEEFKQKMISEESYEELKRKYEEKISEIKSEISKTPAKMIYCPKGHYLLSSSAIPTKIKGYVLCPEHKEEIRVE